MFSELYNTDSKDSLPDDVAEKSSEDAIKDYYSKELKTLDGEPLLDFLLKKKYPDQTNFSDEQRNEVLEKLFISAEIARKKLERLHALWQGKYGERFYQHTYLVYPPHNEWLYSKGNKYQKFLDIAKSIATDGILSANERRAQKNYNNEEDRTQWQGENNISVYDDKSGVFHDTVGLQIITFIIDPKIKNECKITKSSHGFSEENEYNIEGKIPPKFIVGAYVARNLADRKKISAESENFVQQLIATMLDNPENSFPILRGAHDNYPLHTSFGNTEKDADNLTSDERIYFGK